MSDGHRPLVIAHRGASAERRENTLAAFARAVELGADMIETDLHCSADGVVVLSHDPDPPEAEGRELGELTAAEIARLDLGAGTRVPRLDEALGAFGGRIAFNLELKRGRRAAYAGLEQAALAAVRERGLLATTLFSSFHDDVLARLRELSSEARIGLLISPRLPGRALERARALGAEAVHPHVSLVDASWVAKAHASGFKVYPFTVDDPAAMERLLAWGVDGLFTNRPGRLRELVDRRVRDGAAGGSGRSG